MKKLIIIMALLIAAPAMAGDFKIKVESMQYIPVDANLVLRQEIPTITLDWKFKDPFSFFISAEKNSLRMYGQRCMSIDIYGVGGAFEKKVWDILTLSASAGVYVPQWTEGHSAAEGIYLTLRGKVGENPPGFDKYWVDPEFWTLGLNLGASVNVWKNLDVSAGMRFLPIHYNLRGSKGDVSWTWDSTLDAGGWFVGFNYRF